MSERERESIDTDEETSQDSVTSSITNKVSSSCCQYWMRRDQVMQRRMSWAGKVASVASRVWKSFWARNSPPNFQETGGNHKVSKSVSEIAFRARKFHF
ncbi:hypothetical protein E2C01_047914 [Portunus trituberculatus]|uniref:Uncharacterized protein n=1 Tax=Portunus trituberculatus TaxID=210409 RepID=A0A5B7GA55_PORTR|nr:hypothetical protein [Portunus trituberculatus]